MMSSSELNQNQKITKLQSEQFVPKSGQQQQIYHTIIVSLNNCCDQQQQTIDNNNNKSIVGHLNVTIPFGNRPATINYCSKLDQTNLSTFQQIDIVQLLLLFVSTVSSYFFQLICANKFPMAFLHLIAALIVLVIKAFVKSCLSVPGFAAARNVLLNNHSSINEPLLLRSFRFGRHIPIKLYNQLITLINFNAAIIKHHQYVQEKIGKSSPQSINNNSNKFCVQQEIPKHFNQINKNQYRATFLRKIVIIALIFSQFNCHFAAQLSNSYQVHQHQHQQQQQKIQQKEAIATLLKEIDRENIINPVAQAAEEEEEEVAMEIEKNNLPDCLDDNTICGYMQINSVGFNKVPICNCKTGRANNNRNSKNNNNACSLDWNPLDRTIKHGNDFYKYCNRKPKLLPCRNGQLAYTSYAESDFITGDKLMDVQRTHCLCPPDYILKSNRTMFKMTDTSYIYGTENLCQKKPRCTRRQFCLSITETSEATLEKQHCRCSAGKICPRDVRLAYEQQKMDRGVVFNMRCI